MLLLLSLLALVSATDYYPFKYSNCGSSSDPIQVVSPTLTPSPVHFDANVTASATVKVAHDITSANAGTLSFKVQKHALIWVDIPCSAIPGGCSYPNFCEIGSGHANNKTCTLLTSLGMSLYQHFCF